ncbi:MAG: OmpA family protein [Polyangiaceae bacterium]|nr:OmpA family protein [Polyangiaceae bacterium]MCW5789350.1 OmpA family protein [Polyangiaceae bacterium]
MKLRYVTSLPVLLTVLMGAGTASAQEAGFALNRFDPSDRGSDWFALESLDFDGHMRVALGLVGDWAYKPLVMYDGNGDEVDPIVEHQVFAHVGGSITLWDRLKLGVSVPLAVVNSGPSGTDTNSSFSSEDGAGVGDVRVGGDVRLLGERRGAFRLGLGVGVHLPTGDQEKFLGDGAVRVVPRLGIAGDVGQLAYAARVSGNIRTESKELDGVPLGTELGFAAAVGVRLVDDKLLLGPEIYGTTNIEDGDELFAKKSTPFEVVIGGHYQVAEDWNIGLGVGPGLTRGFGSPLLRVLASVEYRPSAEEEIIVVRKDTDGDGIYDDEDACVNQPGVASEDPSKHGCPLPNDSDGDGITDDLDACPNEAGVASEDPSKHGCPLPLDSDGDGIPDEVDACPNEAGVANEDPSKHGCPLPKDTDGDGIMDPEDACPSVPGEANSDPKKHGCPKAQIEQGQIKILEQVKFKTNSDAILPESDEILQAVKKILEENPDIEQISIEGHTDSKGAPAYNKALSGRRAASVVRWLVKNGVAQSRLVSKGFGQEKPIDTNDTEEGRQNNRRVEFHIVKVKAGSKLKVEER